MPHGCTTVLGKMKDESCDCSTMQDGLCMGAAFLWVVCDCSAILEVARGCFVILVT